MELIRIFEKENSFDVELYVEKLSDIGLIELLNFIARQSVTLDRFRVWKSQAKHKATPAVFTASVTSGSWGGNYIGYRWSGSSSVWLRSRRMCQGGPWPRSWTFHPGVGFVQFFTLAYARGVPPNFSRGVYCYVRLG